MSVLDVPLPPFLAEDEIWIFADSVGRFFEQVVPPFRSAKWREQGHIDPEFWREAGAAGLLGVSIPEQYGGGGGDFRHDLVILEQVLRKEVSGFSASLHNGIVTPYILAHGAEAQKQRWLPRLCRGELVAALAMSEPGAGSDLKSIRTSARREDDGYRINGSKTFISSGLLANFIILVAKTDPELGAKGVSLVVVETETAEGFRRGRLLKKVGLEAADDGRVVLRRRLGACRKSSGSGGGSGLPATDEGTAARTACDRAAEHLGGGDRAGAYAGLCEGTQGVWAADLRVPEHPVQTR